MDAKTKELLNKFALSQVALNDREKPFPTSAIQLGDLIQQALDAAAAASAAAADAASAAYVPTTSADWSGDPATIQEALDRLASLAAAESLAPIP